MSNLNGSADIERALADINNHNNTSFTAASFFLFIGHKFNSLLRRRIVVPVGRKFNEAVASLHRRIVLPVGRICDNIGRDVFGEEAVVIMVPRSTFRFTITALLAFTEIKSQGNAGFPFLTHPKAIMVSITSVFIYGFTSAAELIISAAGFDRNSVYAIIARLGRIASLCVLVASLAALFYF